MKSFRWWALALLPFALWGCSQEELDDLSADADADTDTDSDTDEDVFPFDPAAPFALVELFTSEGCSSCPPADRVLGELVEQADEAGRRVFSLAWHVDYWDYLGWQDPFGTAEATSRQYAYNKVHGAGVYTPQMIINGSEVFVGYDEGRANYMINRALDRSVDTSVSLRVQASGSGLVLVEYDVLDAPEGASLNVALVERHLETQVRAGENRGLTLEHDNVVRAYRQAMPGFGSVEMQVPDDAIVDHLSVVAWTQLDSDSSVSGASMAPVIP